MMIEMVWKTTILLFHFGLAISWGQNFPDGARKIYADRCAACHGAAARGTSMGPELIGNRKLRSRSVQQISEVIRSGIPTSGMPAFDLPAGQLGALAAFVRSLNSPAAEVAMPGDPLAGEQFFFAAGRCASCHMVKGRGKVVGPDLSNVASELTVDEIRDSLLLPDARISPGYELVTVTLRDGQAIRGFARSRSNFDIVLQDLKGRIRPLREAEISAIREEKKSFMQPVKAGPEQLQNLLAYLS